MSAVVRFAISSEILLALVVILMVLVATFAVSVASAAILAAVSDAILAVCPDTVVPKVIT